MVARATSEKTGGFYEKKKGYLQPTGIILRPDKTILLAVFGIGPIGRFVAEYVLKIVRHYKSQEM